MVQGPNELEALLAAGAVHSASPAQSQRSKASASTAANGFQQAPDSVELSKDSVEASRKSSAYGAAGAQSAATQGATAYLQAQSQIQTASQTQTSPPPASVPASATVPAQANSANQGGPLAVAAQQAVQPSAGPVAQPQAHATSAPDQATALSDNQLANVVSPVAPKASGKEAAGSPVVGSATPTSLHLKGLSPAVDEQRIAGTSAAQAAVVGAVASASAVANTAQVQAQAKPQPTTDQIAPAAPVAKAAQGNIAGLSKAEVVAALQSEPEVRPNAVQAAAASLQGVDGGAANAKLAEKLLTEN
jgi:hypothetical protein